MRSHSDSVSLCVRFCVHTCQLGLDLAMGETAVYKNTTSEMYYPDGDDISTIQLIPGSKTSSRNFACKQRACIAGTVVGFIVLLTAFIALLVMFHQLRTELKLVKADLKHPYQLTGKSLTRE